MSFHFGVTASEPMLLGSPPSPQFVANQQHNRHLPAYLMGDSVSQHRTTVQHSSGSAVGASSPPKSSVQHSFGKSSTAATTMNVGSLSANRRQAPPTAGLWTTPGPPQPAQNGSNSFTAMPFGKAIHANDVAVMPCSSSTPGGPAQTSTPLQSHSLPIASTALFTEQLKGTPLSGGTLFSPAQVDPFFSQGTDLKHDDVLDGTWVTVFGYPQGVASSLLHYFAQCGHLERHVVG